MSRGAIKIYDDGPLAIEQRLRPACSFSSAICSKAASRIRSWNKLHAAAAVGPRAARHLLRRPLPLGNARQGENPHRFASVGQFPSRMAKLSMLSGSSDSKAIRDIRQSGIWWSIDTLRSRLSDRLGVEMEPPRAAHWPGDDAQNVRANTVLAARRSSWTSSLPLALENRRLVQAQQGYINALNATAVRGADLIGAVFAINGRVEGAEVYQSTALFRQAWPSFCAPMRRRRSRPPVLQPRRSRRPKRSTSS